MEAKTEEFLYMLLWTCEVLSRPTFRNLTESFEGWAYRNGLLRQLQRLEKRGLVGRQVGVAGDRLFRLTEAGRLCALGGRDPRECWDRGWDGVWRLVIFDVPISENSTRASIRKWLCAHGFGCLQQSVWITPHPLDNERQVLAGGVVNVRSLLLLEARPGAGESNEQLIKGAWDFDRINERYARYLQVLNRRPRGALVDQETAVAFLDWLKEERQAWIGAIEWDPLLPSSLFPKEYVGRRAWDSRLEEMVQAKRQMEAFIQPATARQ